MSDFWDQGYELWHDVIDHQTQTLLRTQIDVFREAMEYGDRMQGAQPNYSDELVTDRCWSNYSFVGFEGLAKMLTPQVSERVGLELEPSYTFMRYYYPGATMKRHRDRPACEISMTLTLTAQGNPWPIGIQDLQGQEHSVAIPERSAMIYQGPECDHWRDEYTQGTEQVQVFLHWVSAKNAQWKYDERPVLAVSPSLKRKRLT